MESNPKRTAFGRVLLPLQLASPLSYLKRSYKLTTIHSTIFTFSPVPFSDHLSQASFRQCFEI